MTSTLAPHLAPPLLSWAHYLASRNFRVFPVNTVKRPILRRWPELATTDLDAISRQWQRTPFGNPAYVLDNLVAVDVDTPAGHGVDGMASWRKFLAGRFLPITWEVRSPTGSTHLVFTLPAGVTVTSGAGKLGSGVDVKSGPGAFLVGPGSWTMRGVYMLECEVDPAPCPDHLLAALIPSTTFARRYPRPAISSGYVAAAVRAEVDNVLASTPGVDRNDTLNRASFALARFVIAGRLGEDDMRCAMLDAALTVGLSEREALATVRSALSARERAE